MKLVITRAQNEALAWSKRLKEKFGIQTIVVPLIESRMLSFSEARLRDEDVLVFMSPRAVHYCPVGWIDDSTAVRIVVQGPKTAKAVQLKFGREPLCFPGRTSDEMGPWLQRELGASKPRVVLVRARGGRTALREFLIGLGGEVLDIQAYESVYCRPTSDEIELLLSELNCSLVCFFSPSAVKSWEYNKLPKPSYIASFGPVTSKAISQLGWVISLESPSNEISDFEEMIEQFLAEKIARPVEGRHF
jgi:uroporphyrinogen-III synthase